ncbi:hypothetical protein VPH35_018029 [Triticum aestivum]
MDPARMLPRDILFHLLEEITENFSDERKLGSGAYGKVYLGVDKNGVKIAVKVLHERTDLDDNKRQFETEFKNLESLQHQNIVRLVGYCYETRKTYVSHNEELVFANKIHRVLCFEYMPGKSLDKLLADEHNGLGWHTSYAIIIGICKGLKYLHEELQDPMFHLDLKLANILLDGNMVPKIADFGLSRLTGGEHTQITQGVFGTLGYVPPEYRDKGVISLEFDIFSLGVVIIKIMGGVDAYYRREEKSPQEFIEDVHRHWRNRLQAASGVALESYCKQVIRCVTIALDCVEGDRRKRPTIGTIVSQLNEVDVMCPFPDALRNDPESLETRQTDITEVEGNREREELSQIENLFGEVVDNYKLDQMASYMGKSKTRDDRVREACILVTEDGKDARASRYVEGLKTMHGDGDGQSTMCLVYNATGSTLHHVLQHDWSGHIGRAPYPALTGNGQWAAFHHVAQPGEPDSLAAVLYRGKNKDGHDHDYLLAWHTPSRWYECNKAYCDIGGVDYFKNRWADIHSKLSKSDYSSDAIYGGCYIEAKIGGGNSPKFTARITSVDGHRQHWQPVTFVQAAEVVGELTDDGIMSL